MNNIFDIADIEKKLYCAKAHPDGYGHATKTLYLGTVHDLLPSGKFYTLYGCRGITKEEMEADTQWCIHANHELATINAYIVMGEDPYEIFAERIVG